jgi:hypothetical protein
MAFRKVKPAVKPTAPIKKKTRKVKPVLSPELKFKNNVAAIARSNEDIVIFDIDGCIADDAWRFPYVQKSNGCTDAKYDAYHKGSLHDEKLIKGAYILERSIKADQFIVFITARPEKFREITQKWLQAKFSLTVGLDCALFMRNVEGKSSPDVKAQIFSDILAHLPAGSKSRIIAAYDDREDVVRSYYYGFDINAYILDANGVRDILNIQERNAPGVAPVLARPKAEDTEWMRGGEPAADSEKRSFEPFTAAESLKLAAQTLADRNGTYGRVDLAAASIMATLFPNGSVLSSADEYRLMTMISHVVGKLVRFTFTGMTHLDSIHDAVSYCAFTDAVAREIESKKR